jgi:hypothetical protein
MAFPREHPDPSAQAVPREEVPAIFATAPVIDVDELRADLDEAAGQDLRDRMRGQRL